MRKVPDCISIVFIVVLIGACAKTTKGKITNEWIVVNYAEETIDGDSIHIWTTENSPATPNKLIIHRDGKWTWNTGYTVSGSIFGGSIFLTEKESTTRKGTWSFVGKTKGDNFKKNERLLFNVLSESTVHTQTGGGGNPIFPDTTSTTSNTYLTGEHVDIYTVVKSTRKDLELRLESSHTDSSGEVHSKTVRVILKQAD